MKEDTGFSLIESLVGLILLSFSITVVILIYCYGYRSNAQNTQRSITFNNLRYALNVVMTPEIEEALPLEKISVATQGSLKTFLGIEKLDYPIYADGGETIVFVIKDESGQESVVKYHYSASDKMIYRIINNGPNTDPIAHDITYASFDYLSASKTVAIEVRGMKPNSPEQVLTTRIYPRAM